MVTVLKLGGSVVTEKDTPETVDQAALSRATTAIADRESETDDPSLVIVHGGGSFGHHNAAKHGVSRTSGTHDAVAITEIHRAMGELNTAVVEALQSRSVAALPVRPLSVAVRANGLTVPLQQVEAMLAEGFVPVLHGDVVTTRGAGATVLSGDDIVVALAESLGAQRVGLCSRVPGVLDENDDVIDRIESYEAVASVLGESEDTDVTGGMAGKIERLLDLDTPASVFDLDGLEAFLSAGSAGTVVD